MENNIYIQFDNVSYQYQKDIPILENVNFDIKKGDFLGIKGENGTGKTTLVKLILSLMEPNRGNIIYNIDKYGDLAYVRQDTNQSSYKFPANVREIVSLGLYNKKDKSKKNEKIAQVLQLMNIKGLENNLIGELSGGQRQKVLIAKALIQKPKVLVLDEPDSGIDEKSSEYLYKLLENLNRKEDLTIIVISHNAQVLEKYTKKILLIKDSKVI